MEKNIEHKKRINGIIISLNKLSSNNIKELINVSKKDGIWEFITYSKDNFTKYLEKALSAENKNSITFVVKNEFGKVIGSTTLNNYNSIHKTITSAMTWIIPEYWGKGYNKDIKFTILKYCFETLKIRRVEYVVDENNDKSRKSLNSIFAKEEGFFRNYRNYPNGLYNNVYIYSHILDNWQSTKIKLIPEIMKYKRDNKPKKFFAGGFLYNPKTEEVFLHQRDGNTIYSPNALAFFGGLNEGDENVLECFQRELFEEIGLKVNIEDIIYLDDYLNVEFDTYRYVFYVISNISKDKLTLGEGAGFHWFKLSNIFDKKITEKTKKDLKLFIKKLNE